MLFLKQNGCQFKMRILVWLLVLFFISPVEIFAGVEKAKVVLDDKTIPEIKIYTFDEVEYLSLKDISRVYEAKVHWYPVSGRVELTLNHTKIDFLLDSKLVKVNRIQRKISKPVRLIDDKVYVPLEFLLSPLWTKVSKGKTYWDDYTRTFTFTKKPPPAASAELLPETTSVTVSLLEEAPTALALVSTGTVITSQRKEKPIGKIVIDPGHGGKDPGAISRRGTREKDINLRFAKELARTLSDDYGYQVILTRNRDIFLPLYQRVEIANHAQADLFISIHCNASSSRRLNGFEVYFLSEKATDADAQAVALRENAVIALEDIPPWKQKEIEKILYSLETNVFLNQSSELSGLIAQRVEKKTEINNQRVKQATFTVLRGARMPAVLIELGYLSHADEEKKLRTQQFCAKLAECIAYGVHTYYQKNSNHRKANPQ